MEQHYEPKFTFAPLAVGAPTSRSPLPSHCASRREQIHAIQINTIKARVALAVSSSWMCDRSNLLTAILVPACFFAAR